jgi:hypothetical protein
MVKASLILLAGAIGLGPAMGQSLGTAGTISGVVTDPNGAVIPDATVTVENPVTGYRRTLNTDPDGTFRLSNVPPNNYQITVTAAGFQTAQQSVSVRTTVPINLKFALAVGEVANTTITVSDTADILENVPSTHTDVDRSLIAKLPVNSPGAGLSDVVTFASPGVVADSNGFFHPLGDHAQSQVALDNQPITDQQSKAFSNQVPLEAIQSMEIITGAPPAEYGDKTSLVINAITRSGLGLKQPTGSISTQYGSFGTVNQIAALGVGSDRMGNFTAFNFTRSGRFLDAPEFTVLHDTGNSTSIFNRFDYRPNNADTYHLNLLLARTRYDVPNTFDQQALGQDQRTLFRSIDLAPGYVHVFNPQTVLTVNPYFRSDLVKYLPSANPFADETQTISQQRRLTNTGIRADLAYVKGPNNAKFGAQFSHTFLREAFQFGLTDPAFNAPCVGADGMPIGDPAQIGPANCDGIMSFPNASFLPGLVPFDLTRGGSLFSFRGRTDIKQLAFYGQDALTLGPLALNLGLRYDLYRGISRGQLLQPRVGISYLVKPTSTVLRGSYSLTFETPYNENLILSSATGAGGLAANGVLGDTSNEPLRPGRRNQFNLGLQQGIGRWVVIDADYFWKFTHNAYDFNVLLNTPIAFPISWDQSKLDGVSLRVNLNEYKGFSAFFVAGHTRARFFPPETGGLFFNSDLPTGVFRIDHDQKFEQTIQAQYRFTRFTKLAPYVAFTWRYDSGLVAGSVPDYATALTFTADQQAQIGLFCGATFASLGNPLTSCTVPDRGALRVVIPADGTVNDDHNPPRIAPRHLFDLSIGTDNLLRTEHRRLTLKLTAINLTNKQALYNFLSTFGGTHFVTPRALQAQVGLTF